MTFKVYMELSCSGYLKRGRQTLKRGSEIRKSAAILLKIMAT